MSLGDSELSRIRHCLSKKMGRDFIAAHLVVLWIGGGRVSDPVRAGRSSAANVYRVRHRGHRDHPARYGHDRLGHRDRHHGRRGRDARLRRRAGGAGPD